MGRGAARRGLERHRRFGRVRPQPAEPTDEEKAEIERHRIRNDELANMDDDGWTEELVEEAGANEERLDEIEAMIEARAVYRREDIAIAGCIATVGNDGELKLIQGLVRPEDMPGRESNDANMAGQDDTGDGESASSSIEAPTLAAPLASPGDAEAEARKEAGVGIGLADDLAGHPHGHRQEPARLRLRGGLRSAAVPACPWRVHHRLP